MKVYLLVEYKSKKEPNGTTNIFTEVRAFTSPKERDKAFGALDFDADAEKQDVEVEKRAYHQKKPPIELAQTAGLVG